MISSHDIRRTLTDLLQALRDARSLFHLSGGLTSSFYGEPRFTQDIDIVIRISVGNAMNLLIEKLSKDFIVDPETALSSVKRGVMFQALHQESMIKIDFHVGEAIPGELERSTEEEILEGIRIPLVSKEDAVLSKLIWTQKGSGKSRQDVVSMLRMNPDIDMSYLLTTAGQLGVGE